MDNFLDLTPSLMDYIKATVTPPSGKQIDQVKHIYMVGKIRREFNNRFRKPYRHTRIFNDGGI